MWWSPSLFGLQLEVYSCAVFTKLRGWEREQKQKEIRISQREEAVNMCRVRWCGAGAATSTRGRTPRGHAASEPWLHSIFLPFFSLNLFSKKKKFAFLSSPRFFSSSLLWDWVRFFRGFSEICMIFYVYPLYGSISIINYILYLYLYRNLMTAWI